MTPGGAAIPFLSKDVFCLCVVICSPDWEHVQQFCRRLSGNLWFTVFTTLLTIYALLGDNVRILVSCKH